MWERERERAAASGPPVEPFTKRPVAASQSRPAPGTFMPSEVPAESTWIALDPDPNQPR